MKHLSITLFLLFSSLLSWGQNQINEDSLRTAWKADKKLDPERIQDEIKNEQKRLRGSTYHINKAAFIFEGEGLSISSEPLNEFDKTIYGLVRVGRVFRGDPTWQGKTLEVAFIDYGPNSHNPVSQGIMGHNVFLCQPTDLLPNPKPFQQELPLSLALQSNLSLVNKEVNGEEVDFATGLNGIQFDSRQAFFQFLGTHANIQLVQVSEAIAATKLTTARSARQAISSAKPISYQEWYAHWEKKMKQQSKKKSNTNASLSATSSTNAITFSFANQTVTEAAGKQYFEVDIMTAASQTGKFFHNALSIYS